jgi:hypothetical protein
VNKLEPQPEDAHDGDALAPGSPMSPDFHPPGGAALGDAISAPGSSDIVDLGSNELGLPCYPRVPPLPAR